MHSDDSGHPARGPVHGRDAHDRLGELTGVDSQPAVLDRLQEPDHSRLPQPLRGGIRQAHQLVAFDTRSADLLGMFFDPVEHLTHDHSIRKKTRTRSTLANSNGRTRQNALPGYALSPKIDLTSKNSSMPNFPNSRPLPDCL